MVDINDFFPSVADRVPNIERLKGKTVLVTGASGLIGNHVVATLADVGADISIVQNFNSPVVPVDYESFNWHSLFANNELPKFDYIFHLAGYGQPVKFNWNRLTTINVNTARLADLFLLMRKDSRILFASTSEIYSGLNTEATEYDVGNTTPAHPRAAYIESKRCGEAMIHAVNQMERVGKIARIALAYGPGVRYDDTRVLSDFIKMALEDGVIKPRGGLRNIRTYCFVSDTVTMLFNILLNGKQTTYNIGGEDSMLLRELLYAVAYKTSSKIKFPDSASTDAAPNFVHMSTDRYHNEFPDMEFTNFDTGLEKTIEWFKYLKEKENGGYTVCCSFERRK